MSTINIDTAESKEFTAKGLTINQLEELKHRLIVRGMNASNNAAKAAYNNVIYDLKQIIEHGK